ncbi:MAG: winged helix-turn-helix domain-containing protein [Acidobacteriia bacterium]|nr:winged helix-turn-helix domain-containing protein [Terriglobia bacterium]
MKLPAYEFGGFRLDLKSRRLLRGDEAIPITVKAFDTLVALVEQPGGVVDKDELMRRVWPDAVVEEANLSQQIFLLRKTLGEGPKDHRYIQTVPRRGYRFVADVVEIEACDADRHAAGDAAGRAGAAAAPLRLSLMLSADAPLAIGACSPIAVSPDGRSLAYVAREGGTTWLYLRGLDQLESTRVARTDGASAPFVSPDGKWIGYVAGGRLHKVPATGGVPTTICDASSECRGACWTTRNEILFAPSPASGLSIVSAEGGTPRPATTIDFGEGERTHRWPDALPGGRHVLFTLARAGSASFDDGEIVLASLETGERRVLVHHGSCARYLPTGHLVYMRGGSIMAVAFDAERFAVRGSAIPVVDQVMTQPTGAGYFTCSQTGCLLYLTGESHDVKRRLVWLDANGRVEPLRIPAHAIEEPRISPDGRRVALGIRGTTNDIWIHDIDRSTLTRVTSEGDNFAPIWSPDGTRITFSSNRHGPCHIFSQDLEQTEAQQLVGGDHDLVPGSWSPDGRHLLFTEYNPQTGAGIWVYTPLGGKPPRALIRTRWNDFEPAMAPDGRSFAYTSDESGRFEVYLSPFPEFGAKTPVSVDGGAEPVWSRDGRLYFRSGSSVMMATIDLENRQRIGAPERVADGPYQPGAVAGLPNFDVGAGGRLLLIAQTAAQAQPDRLSVTVNWFTDLASRFS